MGKGQSSMCGRVKEKAPEGLRRVVSAAPQQHTHNVQPDPQSGRCRCSAHKVSHGPEKHRSCGDRRAQWRKEMLEKILRREGEENRHRYNADEQFTALAVLERPHQCPHTGYARWAFLHLHHNQSSRTRKCRRQGAQQARCKTHAYVPGRQRSHARKARCTASLASVCGPACKQFGSLAGSELGTLR